MLAASLALWFIVVYSFRVAIWGNPIHRLVAHADAGLLARVEAATTGEATEMSEDEVLFLRRFSRLGLLEMVMLAVELVVFASLWWVDVLPVLSLALFLKNIAMLGLSVVLSHIYTDDGVFGTLLSMPTWTTHVDRASSLVSGVAALLILLSVNGLSMW